MALPRISSIVVIVLTVVSVSNAGFSLFTKESDDKGLQMNWIERKIKERIESFREILKKGEPALGIPVLDPYHRDSDSFPINTSYVLATTDLEDFSVVGLSSYSVDDVRVSLPSMSATIKLSWTGIKVNGEYNLDGILKIPLAGAIPLYGKGSARALVQKVWIEGKIQFVVEEDEIVTASKLDLSWETDNPKVRIEGLFGGHELGDTINQIIKDIIPKLDATYHDKVKSELEQKVLKLINDYLTGIKDEDDGSDSR